MNSPDAQFRNLIVGAIVSVAAAGSLAADVTAADVPEALRSPRAAMRTFLKAANAGRYPEAATTLDFAGEELTEAEKTQRVERLNDVIDRMAWVDFAAISDGREGPPYRFPPDAKDQPIVIDRGSDGAWQFTAETVARIDRLYELWKSRPRVVAEETPWYRRMTVVGNELWRIAALFASLLVSWIGGRILRALFHHFAASLEKRDRESAAVTLRSLARAVVPALLVVGLQVGLRFLVLTGPVQVAAETIVSILYTLVVGYAVWCLVDVADFWLRRLAAKTESKLDDMLAPMIRASLRVTIVILVLVQVATIVSEKPMTSVIAGLGVGGLAIGLAAQDMIKGFFGSLMIFSDRPFELGDRIQFGNYDGVIETVGFRSTRLRTLDGHLVTIPNAELANSSVRNVAKRPNIRRIMNIGLTYDTPPEKVQQAIEIVEDLLRDHEGQDAEMPPRVFFDDFKDSSLNLFVIYWYHPPDWWAYCEFNQRLHFEILRRFNEAGIEFAFPSQTIYLAGGGRNGTDEPLDREPREL